MILAGPPDAATGSYSVLILAGIAEIDVLNKERIMSYSLARHLFWLFGAAMLALAMIFPVYAGVIASGG
jgi:hypothetical protein